MPESVTLRSHAIIAIRAIENAQRQIRKLIGAYEMPATKECEAMQLALDHFRNLLETQP